MNSARAGFSLLEVMVAIGILGLTLSVILSAQGGIAASNKVAANMGVATTLARCKMTESEETLVAVSPVLAAPSPWVMSDTPLATWRMALR